MIVRCNKCVSAFAVNDDKVADKKFAFTCPKCNSENIIDNRRSAIVKAEKKPEPEKSETNKEELFFDDTFPAGTDEFDNSASEFSSDEQIKQADIKKREINLEIEETAEFNLSDDEDIFSDKPVTAKKPEEDEVMTDLPDFDSNEEIGTFEENESPAKKTDDFDIELKDDLSVTESDDILFDDFNETPVGEGEPVQKNEPVIEDDTLFDIDIPEESIPNKSVNERDKKLSSQDDIDALFAEEGISFEEKPISTQGEKAFEDEITVDIDMLDIETDTPSKEETPVKTDDDNITHDIDLDELDTEVKLPDAPVKTKTSAEDDDITLDIDNLDIDLDELAPEMEIQKSPARTEAAAEDDNITLDIDNLDIDLDELDTEAELPDAPSKTEAAAEDDDITLDIDNLDIDLDELDTEAELPDAPSKTEAAAEDDDITLDIDNLDIDLDELSPEIEIQNPPAKTEAAAEDDDITLDIDNLDIDLDEFAPEMEIQKPPAKTEAAADDDDITLDIDNLDIDLDEFEPEMKMQNPPAKTKTSAEDDDISLDIDNLDIDLDELEPNADFFDEPVTTKKRKPVIAQAISDEDENEFNEEDIKLNLDDLDIDLDEIEGRDLIFEDDIAETSSKPVIKKTKILHDEDDEDDEDESITIDLDTLELELAEEKAPIGAEISEEDEKLTLDDAGLTFDELTAKERKAVFDESADEDIKLTIDEIDPDLTFDKITKSAAIDTELVTNSLDELPEIDLDEFDAVIREENEPLIDTHDYGDDEFIVFPEPESEQISGPARELDILDYDESEIERESAKKGSTFFSIDFSLKYSRIGALLRLLGLYMISMIPHFIVMLVYMMVSSILGFINQIVILSTGRCVEDFALVIENTLRYFFYIKTNVIGIIEDRPVYAGREYLDHPLQLNITYPIKYSKTFAILRLSIIGVTVAMLPHLILMMLMTITVPFVYLIGIITVIVSMRWPNILFIYLTKYFRYLARISSFITGLTDEYPKFKFD